MEINFITVLDTIGIIAFTLIGYMYASQKHFDMLGIVFIAFATAFAGGVFRDILVDKMPFIFKETYPLSVSILTIILAYLFKIHHNIKVSKSYLFLISDSIGMSVFALSGALVALEYKFNFGGIVFLSLITAVGGSIVRDITMNEIPYFLKNEFYGIIAIMIGIAIWLLDSVNLLTNTTTIAVLMFGFILRLIAIKYKWRLPSIKPIS
jgi:uncharacterized membrane protein YeiH